MGSDSPLDAADHISSPTFLVAVEAETHLWRKQVHAFPALAADFARRVVA